MHFPSTDVLKVKNSSYSYWNSLVSDFDKHSNRLTKYNTAVNPSVALIAEALPRFQAIATNRSYISGVTVY